MNQSFLTNKILENAKVWAEKAWIESKFDWLNRSPQDYVYRKYVVNPTSSKIVGDLGLKSNSSVIDIGCGDGVQTILLRQLLTNKGLENIKILGVDLSESLIIKAKENSRGFRNIQFEVGDITEKATAKLIKNKVGNPDLVVASFLLQDVPDLESVLNTVFTLLKAGGHFIAVVVHPQFAEHLLALGRIKIPDEKDSLKEYVSPTGIVQWRFRGYYPIAEENAPPFYLPYFHRTLHDYCNALEFCKFKIENALSLTPNKEVIKKIKIFPFVKSEWNVYWPMIVNEPSSLLLHAIKREKGSHLY